MHAYLINNNTPAAYVPATWHGGWDADPGSTGAYTKMLEPSVKWALNGQSSVGMSLVGTGPYALGIRRFVSRALAAQTISGTLDILAGVLQNTATADFVWKCYAWVSVGDTDVERGVLLDYTETLGVGGATAFPTTRTAKAFASAQALSSVGALAGDRIIIELGVSTATAVSDTHTASVQVGAWGFAGAAYADLAAAETPTTDRAGFFDFSDPWTLAASEPTNVSPDTATPFTLPLAAVPAPTFQAIDLWYAYTPGASDEVLAIFAGRDALSTYEPLLTIFRGPIDAAFTELMTAYYNVADRPYVVRTPTGITTYFRIISIGAGAIAGAISLTATTVPILPPGNYHGSVIITSDEGSIDFADQFAYVLNATTGAITGIVLNTFPAENGAMLGGAQRWLGADENNRDDLILYNSVTFAVVLTLTGVLTGNKVSEFSPINASADTFYVAQYVAGLTAVKLQAISTAGVVGTSWAMTPPTGNDIFGLAVSPTNTVAYYSRLAVNQPIKRWDLVNDVALADLAAGQATYQPADLMTLQDGSILVEWRPQFGGGVGYVARYDPLGVVLQTFDPQTDSGVADGFIDHMRAGVDDPDSFWVWLHDQTTDDQVGHLLHYSTITGLLISGATHPMFDNGIRGPIDIPPGSAPTVDYAPPTSCPLLLVLTAPPSGGGGGGGGDDCPGTRGAANIGA
jgi:hypothetical protein